MGVSGAMAQESFFSGDFFIEEDVMVEGALTGVGNVIVFLPQILILFFFLGLMVS